MCDRCADYDFPHAARWRPRWTRAESGLPVRPPLRLSLSDEDAEKDRIIAVQRDRLRSLRRQLEAAKAELEALRGQQIAVNGYDGIEDLTPPAAGPS